MMFIVLGVKSPHEILDQSHHIPRRSVSPNHIGNERIEKFASSQVEALLHRRAFSFNGETHPASTLSVENIQKSGNFSTRA
jgi:hypothetical protein